MRAPVTLSASLHGRLLSASPTSIDPFRRPAARSRHAMDVVSPTSRPAPAAPSAWRSRSGEDAGQPLRTQWRGPRSRRAPCRSSAARWCPRARQRGCISAAQAVMTPKSARYVGGLYAAVGASSSLDGDVAVQEPRDALTAPPFDQHVGREPSDQGFLDLPLTIRSLPTRTCSRLRDNEYPGLLPATDPFRRVPAALRSSSPRRALSFNGACVLLNLWRSRRRTTTRKAGGGYVLIGRLPRSVYAGARGSYFGRRREAQRRRLRDQTDLDPPTRAPCMVPPP
jgi:hypothetical protein